MPKEGLITTGEGAREGRNERGSAGGGKARDDKRLRGRGSGICTD